MINYLKEALIILMLTSNLDENLNQKIMKKIYLTLILFMSLTYITNAQITVTSADLPVAGLSFIIATDTSVFPVPASGPSQTWNFATLSNVSQDTTAFINAAGTPYTAQFPTANLASFSPIDSVYSYFTSSSSGFYLNGVADTSGSFIYSPAQMFIPTPVTYNNSINSTARTEFLILDDTILVGSPGMPVDIKFTTDVHSNFLCDGHGSLTLPNATHPNTLRLKITDTQYDSIFVDFGLGFVNLLDDSILTTSYRWIGPGPAGYLMGMETDSVGTSIVSTDYLVNYIVGINEPLVSKNQIKAYPNPAIDYVKFEFDNSQNDPAKLEVINELGQSIYNETLRVISKHNLNVSTLPNGIYYFNITTNGRQETGKFVVSH